jgi:predicted nucleic acid-binding protein
MAWCFEDEPGDYADSVLASLADSEAIVPVIWPLEVANVLLVAERRGRLTQADATRFVRLLRMLPVVIDGETSDRALEAILDVGREYGLSSYDAAYLELAMREGLPLATQDDPLRRAAERCGVRLAAV